MTANEHSQGTTGSLSGMATWAESDLPKVRPAAADTRGVSLQGKLLVQGKYIAQAGKPEVVVVTVSPSAVDRKLAIRQMNERLEGKAPTSNTLNRW
jgi:cysteine synthase